MMTAGAFAPTTANGQAGVQRSPGGQPLTAQQEVPKNPNFVDTITVGRLPTGSCEWSKAAQRIRPGKPGTTTRPGPANEKTCTVLAYNYTTGSGQELPEVVQFAYVEDHKVPLPKRAVLNFADTFTVARKADGNCDWSKTPIRTGKRGSSSYLAEVLVVKCWGVVYNVTFPPQDLTGVKADTETVVLIDGPPSRTAFADVRYAVLSTFAKPDTIHISNVRVKGDSAWATVQHSPSAWTSYTLVRKSGAWSIVTRTPTRR
jgi:hypothetical protein